MGDDRMSILLIFMNCTESSTKGTWRVGETSSVRATDDGEYDLVKGKHTLIYRGIDPWTFFSRWGRESIKLSSRGAMIVDWLGGEGIT